MCAAVGKAWGVSLGLRCAWGLPAPLLILVCLQLGQRDAGLWEPALRPTPEGSHCPWKVRQPGGGWSSLLEGMARSHP